MEKRNGRYAAKPPLTYCDNFPMQQDPFPVKHINPNSTKGTTGLGRGERKWHKCWFFPESQDISATDIIPNYTWARTSQTPRGVTDYAKPVPHKPNGAWPDYLQPSATPQHKTHRKPEEGRDDDSGSRRGRILENVKKSKYDFCKIPFFSTPEDRTRDLKGEWVRSFEIQLL